MKVNTWRKKLTGGIYEMSSSAATEFGAILADGASALGGGLGFGQAFIAGATGSIASQAVGMAMGNVKEFSWSQVAVAGIGTMVGNGLAEYMPKGISPLERAGWSAARSMVGSAMTNVITNRVGLTDQAFQWKNVIAAGAGSLAGTAASEFLGDKFTWITDTYAREVTKATFSGVASGVTSSLVSHGKADLRQIATDAFGNALGDSLARLSTAPKISEETLKATKEARELVKQENPEGLDLFDKLVASGQLNANQILRYTTDKEFTTPLSRLNRVINQAEQAKASGQSSQEILTQNVQSDSEISNQNGNVIHVDQENTISVPVKTSVGVAVLQDIGKINGRLTEIKEKYGIDEVMTVAAIAVMGPLGFARALAKDVVTDYVIGDAIGAVNMKAAMVLTAFVHGSSEATVNQVLNFDELHPPGSDAKERKDALEIKEDASKTMAGAIIELIS